MRFTAAILLWCSVASAQLPTVPLPQFKAASSFPGPYCGSLSSIGNGAPTNQAGYAAYTWYVGCGGYGTNSGVATWTNLTTNSGLNLTNYNGLSSAPSNGVTINGYTTLSFGSGANVLLASKGWTLSAGVPFEVFLVAIVTNQSSLKVLGDGDVAGVGGDGLEFLTTSLNSSFYLYNGNAAQARAVCDQTGLTNQWALYDLVFNGASSTIFTNGVQGLTVNPGANQGLNTGFQIPTAYNAGVTMTLAELLTYQTNLTTSVRSNVTYYLTNKYNL